MKIRNLALLLMGVGLCFGGVNTQAQVRILPLGDSVTSSMAPHLSYRYWLWHLLTDRGFDVDFVGTQWGVANGAPAQTDFDMNHEGHLGWTTADGVQSINSIASATVPDIVLLDLGANDVGDDIPHGVSKSNLMTIIETLHAVNPGVVIVMALPAPFVGQNRRGMSQLRGANKRAAKIERRAGVRVTVVNLAAGFNPRRDTFDGTHPDESGEKKIARRYFNVLRKLLR
jgi:lysophospholipase L1-like esterase